MGFEVIYLDTADPEPVSYAIILSANMHML